MGQKAHLPTKIILFICCITLLGCNKSTDKTANEIFEKVDVSQVPNITIFKNDTALKLLNGVYYVGGLPFSGFIKEVYSKGSLKSFASYYQGLQDGVTKTFFENGKTRDERSYKNGLADGRHFGFWDNGNLKFDFAYINDKRQGLQRQWYEQGNPYYALNFTNDQENGMQRAWRENGKLYINYEVKDGERYGLQKSNLCYTLKNEKLK